MVINEKRQTEWEETEGTDENLNPRDKSEALTLIEQANAAAERLVKERKQAEAVKREITDLMAKQALGGKSLTPSQPEPPKELTPKEFKERFLRGEIENPFK